MKVGEVSWNINESVTYTISNIQHTLLYLDSNQQSRINANKTVDIYGGQLSAGLTFNW
jgi:hypothetical protein